MKKWFRLVVFHDGEMARILRQLKGLVSSVLPESAELCLITVLDRASGECWAYIDHEATAALIGATESEPPHDSARYLMLSEERLHGGATQPQFP